MALTRVVAGNTANASDMNQALDALNGNRSDGITFGSDIVGYGANLTLNTLPVPAAPTITQGGAGGSTNYTYEVVAVNSHGDGVPSATTQTTTGNATLSGSNYNIVTWTVVQGATYYRIVRTASSGTPSSTGQITTVGNGYNANGVAVAQPTIGTQSFNDTGLAATAYTASTTNPGGQGASIALIGSSVLGSAAGNITFSSISGSYNHLLLVQSLHSDQAAGSVLNWQLSGDTGTNYDYGNPASFNSTIAGTSNATQWAIALNVPGSNAGANYVMDVHLTIDNYSRTTYWKDGLWIGSSDGGAAHAILGGRGTWKSTAAVTSIKLFPTAGNFSANSGAWLYGIT